MQGGESIATFWVEERKQSLTPQNGLSHPVILPSRSGTSRRPNQPSRSSQRINNYDRISSRSSTPSLSTGDWTTSAVKGLGSAFPSTHWGNPKQHHHGNKTSASMCPSTNIKWYSVTISRNVGILQISSQPAEFSFTFYTKKVNSSEIKVGIVSPPPIVLLE